MTPSITVNTILGYNDFYDDHDYHHYYHYFNHYYHNHYYHHDHYHDEHDHEHNYVHNYHTYDNSEYVGFRAASFISASATRTNKSIKPRNNSICSISTTWEF